MSKSVSTKRNRAYRLLETSASFFVSLLHCRLYSLAVAVPLAAAVRRRSGSGRRRGAMVKRAVVACSLAVALAGITLAREAGAQVPPLSPLQVSGPPNLGDFVRDDEAAKVLGEALFWDSSDGVQACATCHFRAGADPRSKNQIGPDFSGSRSNPARSWSRIPTSTSRGWDRTTGSAERIPPSGSSQIPWVVVHPIGHEQRGVLAGRAPRDLWPGSPARPRLRWFFGRRAQRSPRRAAQHATMINVVFNHRNFWGLRAQNLFNGVNPFGNRDANAFLYRADDPSNPRKTTVSLHMPCDSANHE
jgi:hypothetical protein